MARIRVGINKLRALATKLLEEQIRPVPSEHAEGYNAGLRETARLVRKLVRKALQREGEKK